MFNIHTAYKLHITMTKNRIYFNQNGGIRMILPLLFTAKFSVQFSSLKQGIYLQFIHDI